MNLNDLLAIPRLKKIDFLQFDMPCHISSRYSQFSLRRLTLIQWVLVLWVLLVQGTSFAQDHIVARAWTEDPSGQLTWQEIQQQPFKPFLNVLNKGYGHSAIWLRLRIDPGAVAKPSQDPERLVLRIRPVHLNDIRVFDPLVPQGLAGIAGDNYHPSESALQGVDFLLPIARGNEPRDIWLRVTSTSTRQIAIQALNTTDLNQITQRQQLLFSIYIGLILCLALWGIVHWLFSGENVIGAFGLQQFTALLYAFNSLGFMRAFWPLDWPAWLLDELTSVFSMTAVSAAVLFHVLLISEFKPQLWLQRTLWVMPTLLLPKLIMLAAGWPIGALRLNMMEVLLSPWIFLAAVLASNGWSATDPSQRPVLSRTVAVSLYVLLVVVLMIAGMAGLGMASGGEVPLYIVQVHGLLTAFLVLMLLQYRAHMIQKQQRETALALERSELQIQQDRAIRDEQEKLLTMLAHELKTPLATMHMRLDVHSEGNREIKKAINDMNGVIDRCLQTTLLGDRQLVAQVERCELVNLLRDAVSACTQPQRIETDAPTEVYAQTDRQLFFIVLNNLLENACKYAKPNTPIHATLRHDADGKTLVFEVRNLPHDNHWPDAKQVFDKYYRSPYARRQAGTGLGLFLVNNLMQTLGGDIRYAPDETWVRFVVRMPLST